MGQMEVVLRSAIKKSRMTGKELAQRAGVAESLVSRFMTKKTSITLTNAERLAKVLGLELK